MELWTILGLSGGRKRRHNEGIQEEAEEEESAAADAELSFYETTTYQAGEIQNCRIQCHKGRL